MYCKNCGNKLNNDWKYCPNCQANIETNNNFNNNSKNIDNINNSQSIKKFQQGEIICIIAFFIGIIGISFDYKPTIFFLVSLISITFGAIKYPSNKIIKLLFIFFLISFVLLIVYLIAIVIFCKNATTVFYSIFN